LKVQIASSKKMQNQDIRWQQRFTNFKKAFVKLTEVVADKHEELSELEKEGLIQRFEYTYELAWKTLQDLLRHKGYLDIAGPNPVLRQAFQDGYFTDSAGWAKMKKSRELTSHTYDSELAETIADDIVQTFYHLLLDLKNRLEAELANNPSDYPEV
jgi:nucleotidyltransferase substrate binding protein (TIGR01987 family)